MLVSNGNIFLKNLLFSPDEVQWQVAFTEIMVKLFFLYNIITKHEHVKLPKQEKLKFHE